MVFVTTTPERGRRVRMQKVDERDFNKIIKKRKLVFSTPKNVDFFSCFWLSR